MVIYHVSVAPSNDISLEYAMCEVKAGCGE